MTEQAALPDRRARERRRAASASQGLYDPLDWVMVRAPLLPVERYLELPAGAPASDGASRAPRDPFERAALAVGSRDLLGELERAAPSAKQASRQRGKLLRYRIRMSTRPTPYGLFAGVAIARSGPTTDLRIGDGAPRTRTRPDMAWLLRLVSELEARPEVRRELHMTANPAVLVLGGRARLAERAVLRDGEQPAPVDVRATAALLRTLALARTPIAYRRLADELMRTPAATDAKVDGLLSELWRQTFLLTELRPPLTHPNPARHVAERLARIAAAEDARAALDAVLDAMAAWDELAFEQRPDAYRRLSGLAAAAVADFKDPPAQVDAALALAGTTLNREVANTAARAGELLLRLSPARGDSPQLESYGHAFAARYGPDREVPLLELLDPQSGLGPPSGHAHGQGGTDATKLAARDRALRALAIGALRDRRLAVGLDAATLAALEISDLSTANAPLSLDIAAFVLAASPAAIDRGDFRLMIGPNLGASAAGRNLGRFGDLLGAPAQDALASTAREHARRGGADVAAELVYMPVRGRLANVAIRPAVHDHEIVLGTSPGVQPEGAIRVDELVVGMREGRFYVHWPPAGADVRVHAGHMLNSHTAPAVVRFLEDVERDGRVQLSSFDWGTAAELPFLPRAEVGRIVLCVAQWRVDAATRDELRPESPASFETALAGWRKDWMVPRHVYLAAADNRLLLDLDDPAQAEQLREELRQLPDHGTVLLQEPLPGPEHAWMPGPDGHHMTELVVPIVLRDAPVQDGRGSRDAIRPRCAPSPGELLRPPGSDWLYAKLYGSRADEDGLLTGPVRGFCEFALGSGLADRWFFLRYADPEPHLRLRFGGSPRTLTTRLFGEICSWAAELIADGACTRVCFDTYEREIERYGGSAAIDAAEDLFAADSRAVVELLHLTDGADPETIDRSTLGVVSIDALLEGLGVGAAERLDWYGGQVVAKHLTGQDYRRRQPTLRRLLGDPDEAGEALTRVLEARHRALAAVAVRLDALEERGELEQPRARLCQSFVHLHCNRLLGTASPGEQHVLGLLLRTRESLQRAPLAATRSRTEASERRVT
jgi:thiopeptide-type bacteriocin biosynthesis protein